MNDSGENRPGEVCKLMGQKSSYNKVLRHQEMKTLDTEWGHSLKSLLVNR